MANTKNKYGKYSKEDVKNHSYTKVLLQEAGEQERENNIKSGNGSVILTAPVHLLDDTITVLNYDKPERERIIKINKSRNAYRKFDGGYHRHCSQCPHSEGCIMCCLP